MVVKEILNAAGFIENKTFKETRFLKAPSETYAVYMVSFAARGADNANLVKENDNTIELYSYAPDPDAELRIENALDERGIEYTKQDRYWMQTEQLFQTIYEFTDIVKNK